MVCQNHVTASMVTHKELIHAPKEAFLPATRINSHRVSEACIYSFYFHLTLRVPSVLQNMGNLFAIIQTGARGMTESWGKSSPTWH